MPGTTHLFLNKKATLRKIYIYIIIYDLNNKNKNIIYLLLLHNNLVILFPRDELS